MTVLDRMPADDLASRITNGPTGYSGVVGDEEWAAEVRRLAAQRGATLLAHNYQLPAIQDVADHVGDSLALSRIAAEAPEDTIVFCGVHFMAETAKILSPDKTVLIPDQRAGCSLADSITADELRAWKAEHPGAVVVSYVNTTAAVKAETDICCTSSNAVEVVASDPRGPRGAVLPGPVPRRPRAAGHRPQEPARLGRRVPRARRHQRRRARRPGPRSPGRRTVRAPRMRLRHFGSVPRRRGRLPRGPGEDPVHRRHAGRRPRDPRAAGAGRHRGRHAAPIAPRRTGSRLPRRQRPRVVQVHEDDHAGRTAALPGGRRRRGRRRSRDRPAGARQRAADDRDRSCPAAANDRDPAAVAATGNSAPTSSSSAPGLRAWSPRWRRTAAAEKWWC